MSFLAKSPFDPQAVWTLMWRKCTKLGITVLVRVVFVWLSLLVSEMFYCSFHWLGGKLHFTAVKSKPVRFWSLTSLSAKASFLSPFSDMGVSPRFLQTLVRRPCSLGLLFLWLTLLHILICLWAYCRLFLRPRCAGLFAFIDISNEWIFSHERLDFFPEHCNFFRDRRIGLLGSSAALGCFFIWP